MKWGDEEGQRSFPALTGFIWTILCLVFGYHLGKAHQAHIDTEVMYQIDSLHTQEWHHPRPIPKGQGTVQL